MTLTALATISDLEARLGTTITSAVDVARAGSLLDGASAKIRAYARTTWEAGTVPDLVREVALDVVQRGWSNPAGLRQRSIGDASWTYTDAAGLVLTDTDKALIGSAVDRPRPAAFTIDTTPAAAYVTATLEPGDPWA